MGSAIQSMTDRIAHRGPDAEGIYADEHIALGHRRLSIIDLSEEANQPMWDITQRYVIVYKIRYRSHTGSVCYLGRQMPFLFQWHVCFRDLG